MCIANPRSEGHGRNQRRLGPWRSVPLSPDVDRLECHKILIFLLVAIFNLQNKKDALGAMGGLNPDDSGATRLRFAAIGWIYAFNF